MHIIFCSVPRPAGETPGVSIPGTGKSSKLNNRPYNMAASTSPLAEGIAEVIDALTDRMEARHQAAEATIAAAARRMLLARTRSTSSSF